MLILLRHGRTAVNAEGLLQGRCDPPLDDVGVAQARAAGESLRARFPRARVISSPLRRAVSTAGFISDEVILDERFIELDYGEWDSAPMSAVPWEDWRADPSLRPPGGETLVELDARVRPALEELGALAAEGDVIVVSHVSPIKSAVTWALGTGPTTTWRLSLDRCAVSTIRTTGGSPVLVSFNDTAHLAGLPR